MIQRYPPDSFSWSRWRRGVAIWEIVGAARFQNIVSQAQVLREFAVGYCPAGQIRCRPKPNCVAVLFIIDDEFCWTHLQKEEFDYIFMEANRDG